ncbi:hypothetical protein LJR084_006629 [Variovorax sp. LjRoot84]
MIIAEEYLNRSRLFRRLKSGAHGQLVELYAARLVEVGLAGHGTWRCLNVVGDLLAWMASRRTRLTNLDERVVERYLLHRGGKQTIQPGDRAALKRWLLILRTAGTIAPAALPANTPQEQIFAEFSDCDYLRSERGLAARTIVRHLPAIRRFLREVCPAGATDLGKIRQEEVIHYIERHAQDWSPSSGKGAALPRNDAAPRGSTGMRPPSAMQVAGSIRIVRFASLVCASSRAARFTVSPMQV